MSGPPPAARSAPLDSKRHWLICGLLTLAAALLAVAAMAAFRGWIDRHQRGLPRYAAERALEALEAGDLKEASRQTAIFADERPYAGGVAAPDLMSWTKDGPVLRNRVAAGERLTAGLLKQGMLAEAEAAGWKTIREYHVTSRTLEIVDPWLLMLHVKLRRGDPAAGIGCMKILGETGFGEFPRLDALNPIAYPFDPDAIAPEQDVIASALLSAFQRKAASDEPADLLPAAELAKSALTAAADTPARRRISAIDEDLLAGAGERAQARAMLAAEWGRDPAAMDSFWQAAAGGRPAPLPEGCDPLLLDAFWSDRPPGARIPLTGFVDAFAGDPRVRIDGLQSLAPVRDGWFAPRDAFSIRPDGVVFDKNGTAALDIEFDKPIARIFLAYRSKAALGVWPILLVAIDGAPPIPVDCNSETPALAAIDVGLPAGKHRIELTFLNEGAFYWAPGRIEEHRQVALERMAAVAAPPQEPPR
jgi:hypothetical protein